MLGEEFDIQRVVTKRESRGRGAARGVKPRKLGKFCRSRKMRKKVK